MLVKKSIMYLTKEIGSIIFSLLGGVYWIKVLFMNKKVLIILNYHNFSKYNNYKVRRGNILETGYTANFEQQIRFLKKHFSFVYPDEFFSVTCKRGINCLITFDDGYKDNYEIAYPVLLKYNCKAIFFITTAFMDSTDWLWHDKVRYLITKNIINSVEGEGILKRMNQGEVVPSEFKLKIDIGFPNQPPKRIMMNWEEVTKIFANGIPVGSHTSNHAILSSLDSNSQGIEIKQSLETIKKNIDSECNYFAFPNGLYNETTLKLLQQYGIRYGFSIQAGINMQNADKMTLKRIGVMTSDTNSIVLLRIFKSIWG